MKPKFILMLGILLLFISIAHAQTVGCCLNPGAGALTCATERLSNLEECCPQPEADNPDYYSSLPTADFQTCADTYFIAGQSCDGVNQCQSGCCCTTIGTLSADVTSQVQCTGTGKEFLPLQAGSTCNEVCEIPECADGIDNDNNGCKDYPVDEGCSSSSDTEESGGTCFQTGQNCAGIDFEPEYSFFTGTVEKGKNEIKLEWQVQCSSTLTSQKIFRCEGQDCTDFTLIKTLTSPTQRLYIDSQDLNFNTIYTYKIEAYYSDRIFIPTRTTMVSTGDLECWNQLTSNNFCIHEGYYNQYTNYLIANIDSITSENFINDVRNEYANKLNKAYFCNAANILVEEGTVCSNNQVCVVSGNTPSCLESSSCDPQQDNPFGFFFTTQLCESNNFCFYDRSASTVDACFSCSTDMSCYDYKSQDSCQRNNCNLPNCAWNSLSDEIGTGVCLTQNADNCQWCDSLGTPGLESTVSTSLIFEQCTQEKATQLSTPENICYFDGQSAINCNDIKCTDLQTSDCSSSPIQLDQNNEITSGSSNICGIEICQLFSNMCKKNADGNSVADCTSDECEQDVYAPNTTLIPVIERGIYKSLIIEINDKTSGRQPPTRKTTSDYKTYICKGSCPGHPFDNITLGRSLIISNLNLFDAQSTKKLFLLDEGINTLRYYSQDPAKNLGKVKTIQINAKGASSGPIVANLSVTDANKVGDDYYTQNRRPQITVEFFEPAIVTSAELFIGSSNAVITPAFSSALSDTVTFALPQQLNLGTYVFVINAKNSKDLFMDIPYSAKIIIDDQDPQVISVSPGEGSLLESSDVSMSIEFNKEVNLEELTISGEDVLGEFTTNDDITYTADLELSDGNKQVRIVARDFAGNSLTHTYVFTINADPLDISIVEPSFGISSTYTFDLEIKTDNDATCKYSFDLDADFINMLGFDQTGSTAHIKSNFDEIASNDNSIHKLYVTCNDPLQGQSTEVFDIVVDTAKPRIITAFASPDPIVESPRATDLKVETDKVSVCKYSESSTNFENMQQKFPGFGNNTFSISHIKNLTVTEDGSFKFYVACMAKNELVSDVEEITFTSDLTLPLTLTSHTPQFFNTTTVTLSVETNKRAQCFYADNPNQITQPMGPIDYSHTKTLIRQNGEYTFYVRCIRGSERPSPISITFGVDTTPPIMSFVNDSSTLPNNPEFTWRTDKLRAKWLGIDDDTRVNSYLYTIQEFGSLATALNWTRTTIENDWVYLPESNGLNLVDGTKYLFKFKARNIVNLLSNELESDGITVDTSLKPSTCFNNKKDINETDIDCGGACDSCSENKACEENADCISGFCNNNNCKVPTCSDNFRNQDESDIDCGGSCTSCTNGQKCIQDSDCSSNFCSFGTCRIPDSCDDGILSGTETDIDCGGACPNKCFEGQTCESNSDCASSLFCISSGGLKTCSEEEFGAGEIPDRDSDSDGIPDRWEIEQGMDPNDPSDAAEDNDQDGLTNLEEYNYRTDPNNPDTDGDGATDKKEIDKGSDPLDPESKPKGFLGTFLLILLVIAIIAGGGYGSYYYYSNYIKKTKPTPIKLPFSPSKLQRRPARIAPKEPKPAEIFKKKEEEKWKNRGKLFDVFGKKKKPEHKEEKKLVSVKKSAKTHYPEKGQDVFSKLKLISKKPSSSKTHDEETIKKLRQIGKRKPKKR